jgi:glutathione S-transferase
MLKIWGRTTSSNVQKVLWACAEMNIPFERVDAGLHFGRNRDPEYLALNPNGLVPTIEDGKAIVWESNAILRYLAATRGFDRLHPKDPVERSHVERWMDWQLSVVAPPMGQLLFGLVRTKPEARDPAAIEGARRRALSAWMIVDDEIRDRGPYLAGKELSLAEIVLGTQIYRWFAFPIERPSLDNLRAWYDRLRERPGFKTHIETAIT